jgi:hypothetical protein
MKVFITMLHFSLPNLFFTITIYISPVIKRRPRKKMSVASGVGAVVSVRHALAIWHACSAPQLSSYPRQGPRNAYLHHDKGRPAPAFCYRLHPF